MDSKKQFVMNMLVIILGNLSIAVATSLFILPFDIIVGGTSGLGVVLKSWFGFNPEIVITIAVWVLFFIGWIFLGKDFALKTLMSTFLYPVFITLFSRLDFFQDLINQVTDPLLATFMGAVLFGLGMGVVYRVGASTGGFDVICLLMKKYLNIKLSIGTLLIDGTIIALGLVSISLQRALYGIVCVAVCSYVIEKITISGTNSYMAHIVSDKAEEINDYLINQLHRGSTLIKAEGGRTKDSKTLIEVVFNEKEYYEIKKNIHKIDKNAFISVYKSINAYGLGFEEVFIRGK